MAVNQTLDEDSIVDVLFPWLPTPSKIMKLFGYAKLHRTIQKIIKNRRQTGRVENDIMNMMMDEGHSDTIISLVRNCSVTVVLSESCPNVF
jgi:sterol 14-demethylase